MTDRQADLATRLRLLSGEAKSMLSALSTDERNPDPSLRPRLAAWIETLDSLISDAENSIDPAELTTRGLLIKALSGADIDLDGVHFSLHDITQLAAALRPGASLVIRNSDCLTPIEQTSIWTVMPGQVRFA